MGSPAMPPQEFTGPQDKGINASADIPVIDLTSWNEASTQVSSSTKASQAATWHQAFSTHGLVWLVGHGLDPLYEHVAANWKHFCQHDDAEKRKYSALWYGSSGYNKVGSRQDTKCFDPHRNRASSYPSSGSQDQTLQPHFCLYLHPSCPTTVQERTKS